METSTMSDTLRIYTPNYPEGMGFASAAATTGNAYRAEVDLRVIGAYIKLGGGLNDKRIVLTGLTRTAPDNSPINGVPQRRFRIMDELATVSKEVSVTKEGVYRMELEEPYFFKKGASFTLTVSKNSGANHTDFSVTPKDTAALQDRSSTDLSWLGMTSLASASVSNFHHFLHVPSLTKALQMSLVYEVV